MLELALDGGRRPLFSIIWYGRDRLDSAKQTLEALKSQTCPDFELIVEDCGSTDGTFELFKAAAQDDDRIRVFQRWAKSTGDALLSAFRRCHGENIAICPPEGHFVSNALDIVAKAFDQNPSFGAICTSGFLIDGHGNTLNQADIVALLLTNYRPFLPAAFFRRRALVAAGIHRHDWLLDSFALDLCCKVATGWGLIYLDEKVVDSNRTARLIDGLPLSVNDAIGERLELVSQHFSRNGFFSRGSEALALESKVCQLGILWQEFRGLERTEIEQEILSPLYAIVEGFRLQLGRDHRTLRNLHRLLCIRSYNLGLVAAPIQRKLSAVYGKEDQRSIDIGYKIWSHPLWGNWVIRKVIASTVPSSTPAPGSPSWEVLYADLHLLAAERYETRGQIELALSMFDRARPPDNANVDSVACQAMLKSPSATEATLAARQQQWVDRHLGERPSVVLPYQANPDRRIRIGYHCAFMDKDTMRNMMREVIIAHDRTRFEVFGYSPEKLPPDIYACLDKWRHTPTSGADVCTDQQFADLLRADKIDVFVELTGFSPHHRFGAMSLRCAPVQISFLNHTGTSKVPNVDYVISDEICIPTGAPAEKYYSEKIWRIPGTFFCFDYTKFDEPPVTVAPHLKNGYVTFGCFGTGAKINRLLIEIWASLLHRVPNAMLHLQNPQLSQPSDRQFMADRFEACGIEPRRIILEGGVDRSLLLRSYGQVDISLDTWPYSGGNTIAESLWHGVPVVTYRGDRFASSYGASLVNAAGCGDLVGHTPEQYVDIAANLAADSTRLVHLRQNLRKMSVEHGLGDSKLFARRMETAFTEMLSENSPH